MIARPPFIAPDGVGVVSVVAYDHRWVPMNIIIKQGFNFKAHGHHRFVWAVGLCPHAHTHNNTQIYNGPDDLTGF